MDDVGTRFECRLRGKFKLIDKKITNPIAVGDRVNIIEDKAHPGTWIIKDILPRSNYIIRKSPKKTGHGHLLAANIDQAILIATIALPATSTGFIDRFLVTAESFRIPASIIINKKDLFTDRDQLQLSELKNIYEQIGYPIRAMSAFEIEDINRLKSILKGQFTLLSGHSGVGKSTIINALVPGAQQKVSEVSSFANKGVHTTTFAEVFELSANAHIIDTPGIKELGLLEIEKGELSHYFPEMRQFLGECKFNNCQHLEEPGCRILQGIEEGEIHPSRYLSYLSMLEDHDNRR